MKIKRLEVIGFKSFCDKSVVTFDQPITAVVGPNGCGKSNIVDAIRWCMGEQSAKHLRGGAMQDVIFGGSDSRGPLGMCEVTLVFENDGRVPLEYLAYSEIAVTRKLHRDGTSEYFLNKTPCRLRDVVDFFLGTGIGAKAYSIIEQGRVGMIVSSKPEDRRFLIEEAAGITKYKAKKKLAEKKMDATKQNLLRITDVVAEIEKQLASLRRQAQKAERYKQYKTELRDIELWTASQRWIGYVAEERVAEEAHAEVSARREDAQARLSAREGGIEAARLESSAEEEQLSQLQQGLYELDNRIKLSEAEADHEEREAQQLDRRGEEARAEIELLEKQSAEDALALEVARADLAQLETITAGQDVDLHLREEALRAAKDEVFAVQQKTEATRAGKSASQAEIARAEQAERAAGRRGDDLNLRASRVSEEQGRLAPRAAELQSEIATLTAALDGLRQLKLNLLEERDRAEARVAELKTALQSSGAELDALTAELHQVRSRKNSLEELHSRYQGFARGTRAIMREQGSRWGIRGLVADLIEAPAELEPAIEAVLAERLGAVVVETQEVGIDAVDFLKSKNEGRATFVPLSRLTADALREAGTDVSTAPLPEAEGVRGRLLDHVRVADEYRALASWLFADVVMVDDLLTAVDLLRSGHRWTFVSASGEVIDRHGVVTGGSHEAATAGVLAQKRELRELETVLVELEARHGEASARVTAERTEHAVISRSLEVLRSDAHQGEMDILTHDKDLGRLKGELERAHARLQILEGEQAELGQSAGEVAREAEELQLQLRAERDRLVQLEDELSALGRQAVSLLETVEASQEALTRVRIEVGQSQEKRSALTRAIERFLAGLSDQASRRDRLEQTIREGATRSGELRAQAEQRRRELLTQAEERSRMTEAFELGRSAHEERRARLAQEEAEVKAVRSELALFHEEATALELKRHDLQAGRRHLEESIAERYRLVLSMEIHAHHLRPLAGESEERRTRELRDLIDRMGEINLNAIEEYNQLEVRFTFLSSQKTDLETALAQLDEAIDRINKTSRKRFREVFDLVNLKFQEIFPRCFRGGQARLVLTDEDNLLESGIEIVAQPPGKKIATVEQLSGGEKAMTAVALIFAIFLIKPTPFCLLDEVDAPLDEANVGRFNDLIREMTDRTQFIVITHNKRTMQIADTLYGVTMEEPGVSKLVSVNLGHLGHLGKDGKDSSSENRRSAAA